jgi:hypothetical protein
MQFLSGHFWDSRSGHVLLFLGRSPIMRYLCFKLLSTGPETLFSVHYRPDKRAGSIARFLEVQALQEVTEVESNVRR